LDLRGRRRRKEKEKKRLQEGKGGVQAEQEEDVTRPDEERG